MPWYEIVNMLIGMGIGIVFTLYIAWALGWWRRTTHVAPFLEKLAEDESTLLRYEPEENDN